ncbi:MAG: pyridoxal phosphate-dependent aminotransferase, partial [Nitrospinota bacterium]
MEKPAIVTGGIGEAGMVGRYLQQLYPQEAIISAIGEAMDDHGTRCYLPTFVQETIRVYRERPDEAIAYGGIGGQKEFLDIVTRLLVGDQFQEGYIARVGVAGLTSALYTSLYTLSRGNDVLVPQPAWPSYTGMVKQIEGRYLGFPLFTDQGRFNLEGVASLLPQVGPRVTLILNTPFHNPTGYTLERQELQELRSLLWKAADSGKQVTIIIDPAYMDFHWYTPRSVLQDVLRPFFPLHDQVTLAVGWSLSKSHLAYGERLGALLCITNSARRAEELQQQLLVVTRITISQPATTPQLVVEALHTDPAKLARLIQEREQVRLLLAQRNQAFEKGVQENGLTALPGDGGFFRTIELPAGVPALEV